MIKTRTVKSTEEYTVCDICGKGEVKGDRIAKVVTKEVAADGTVIYYDTHDDCLANLVKGALK